MNTATYVAFMLIASAALLLKSGPTQGALAVLGGLALLMAIPWYFGTRNRAVEASRVERAAATVWVWVRRVAGLLAGTVLIGAGVAVGSKNAPGQSEHPWLIAAVLVVTGVFCIYVGIVGQGPKRYEFRDDLELHSQNKRRYRWWL